MKLTSFVIVMTLLSLPCLAQTVVNARNAYQQQMAVQEVQRLAQQFDQLIANQDQLVSRVQKLEIDRRDNDSRGNMQAEIASLKAQIAELKRAQEAMRREIVAELAKKIATLPAAQSVPDTTYAPASGRRSAARSGSKPAPPPPPAYTGNYYEHEVEVGQTLSLIAREYGTTVNKILSANPGLKSNSLRAGRKIKVPAEDKKK